MKTENVEYLAKTETMVSFYSVGIKEYAVGAVVTNIIITVLLFYLTMILRNEVVEVI